MDYLKQLSPPALVVLVLGLLGLGSAMMDKTGDSWVSILLGQLASTVAWVIIVQLLYQGGYRTLAWVLALAGPVLALVLILVAAGVLGLGGLTQVKTTAEQIGMPTGGVEKISL